MNYFRKTSNMSYQIQTNRDYGVIKQYNIFLVSKITVYSYTVQYSF